MRSLDGEPAEPQLASVRQGPGQRSQSGRASQVRRANRTTTRQQRNNSRELKRDRKLVQKLQVASEDLLDRLFTFLSNLPEESGDPAAAVLGESRKAPQGQESLDAISAGITLPASAIGWLASQLFGNARLLDPDHWMEDNAESSSADLSSSVLSASVHDRLSLLKFLLPRLRHLRISADPWPKTRQNKASLAPDEAPSAFLEKYLELLHRPCVDLRLFTNLTVLVLDQVPPDRLLHLSSLQHLQVLRIEQSCIYSLPNLLGRADSNVDSGSNDPLAYAGETITSFLPQLKKVKLSHCCLTSDSLVDERQVSPLSRLTQIQALSLSHNQLRRSAPVLRALRNKPFLSKLDLSHNQLTRLHQAHLCLGNLQELNLSHNWLVSTEGLDRLFSLEAVWLHHNCLPDVASVAGLARLPLLRQLTLHGNPLECRQRRPSTSRRSRRATRADNATPTTIGSRHPNYYRVPVLDLFVQRRLPALGPHATWRQLQLALPELDGEAPSVRDLQALRQRAFVVTPTAEGYLLVNERRTYVPAGAPSLLAGRPPRCANHVRRAVPVQIEDEASSTGLVAVDKSPLDPNFVPIPKFTLMDVLESISNGIGIDEQEAQSEGIDNVEPVDDEINVMKAGFPTSDLQLGNESDVIDQVRVELDEQHGHAVEPVEPYTAGDPDWQEDADELISASSVNESRLDSALDISCISPIRHADHVTQSALKSSGATTATCTTTETPVDHPESPTAAQHMNLATTSEAVESDLLATPAADEPQSSESSNQTPAEQLNYRVLSSNLWQDDNVSVATSTGASHPVDETHGQQKYALAEENSIFDIAAYKQLNVSDNLEFYFQIFVFNYSLLPAPPVRRIPLSAHSTATTIDGHGDWMSVLEHYPKIQLWPLDRRMREAYAEKAQLTGKLETNTAGEELRRVWTEKVVACGQPALRRLTPNRGARFGFHGELLWSAASTSHIKPETVAECRELIVCLSSTSLYLIVHHDSVSTRTIAKDPHRHFPLPVARDATFQDAKWPHALAWHPWHTLAGITIGFGFQRLTLRFANSTFPSPDDFTYVFLTCNKLETVRLLKEIQSLATDNGAGMRLGGTAALGGVGALAGDASAVTIDNDDRHVLDALGVAVAPDVMGAILHYQIVWQYWRHGDRGTVRRVCVVTDATMYLLDEDYVGDGSESMDASHHRALGETTYRVVDTAALSQISVVQAANVDPCALTVSIRPTSRLSRTHNWRLMCKDREGAEQLVDDLRKATAAV